MQEILPAVLISHGVESSQKVGIGDRGSLYRSRVYFRIKKSLASSPGLKYRRSTIFNQQRDLCVNKSTGFRYTSTHLSSNAMVTTVCLFNEEDTRYRSKRCSKNVLKFANAVPFCFFVAVTEVSVGSKALPRWE